MKKKLLAQKKKFCNLKLQIFDKLLTELQDYIAPIQVNGSILAVLDCLCCFANNALQYNYKKPQLHEGYELDLKESRHPVIEQKSCRRRSNILQMIFCLTHQRNKSLFLPGQT